MIGVQLESYQLLVWLQLHSLLVSLQGTRFRGDEVASCSEKLQTGHVVLILLDLNGTDIFVESHSFHTLAQVAKVASRRVCAISSLERRCDVTVHYELKCVQPSA